MLPPPPIDAKIPDGDLSGAPLPSAENWQEDADLLATGAWNDDDDDDEEGLMPFPGDDEA